MEFIDSHCHIHFPDYPLDSDEVIESAKNLGVKRMICVGCTLEDSKLGVDFVQRRDGCWASIGIHPHESSRYVHDHEALHAFRSLAAKPKVVAVGETGLDYHYMHSSADQQEKLLRLQIDIAIEQGLPLIFHIRDAFDDFWRVFDEYSGLRGVVHSFSATEKELDEALERGLYIGLNGIMTFTKDKKQLEAVKKAPIDKLMLETDAPYLTPAPFRGKICSPEHVRVTGSFLSELRGEKLEDLASATTANARKLFRI
jgi:TatD DNase family protein